MKQKPSETKIWQHVTADMMSEEEPNSDGFIRHQLSWRCEMLNNFFAKLDKRHLKKNKKTLAKKRTYGKEIARQPPPNVPAWMVAKCSTSESKDVPSAIVDSSSDDEFSSELLSD